MAEDEEVYLNPKKIFSKFAVSPLELEKKEYGKSKRGLINVHKMGPRHTCTVPVS